MIHGWGRSSFNVTAQPMGEGKDIFQVNASYEATSLNCITKISHGGITEKITSLIRLHNLLNHITFDSTDITGHQPWSCFFKFLCICTHGIPVCFYLNSTCIMSLMKSRGCQSTAVNRINKDCHEIDIFYGLKTSFIDFHFIFMSDTFHSMMDNVTVTVNRVDSRKTPHGKQHFF